MVLAKYLWSILIDQKKLYQQKKNFNKQMSEHDSEHSYFFSVFLPQ